MTTWARNVGGTAVDVTTVNPSRAFVPSLAAEFIVVPDGTLPGATYSEGSWTNPSPPSPAAPTVNYPLLKPADFYISFTTTERMLIKLLASSGGGPANSPLLGGSNSAIPQDALIAEFWASFELAVAVPGTMIDTGLPSIQEGLAYMTTPTSPTPAVLAAGRAAKISQGIPQ